MFRRLGHLICVIALFAVCGGHWAVLQTAAWAQMLHAYSQESGWMIAVHQTFSGERPCSMCEEIREGRQKEQSSPAYFSFTKKFELALEKSSVVPLERTAREENYSVSEIAIFFVRNQEPTAPIPRFA